MTSVKRLIPISLCIVLAFGTAFGQTRVTTPKEFFGHNIGDDYVLINYTKFVEYMKKLDQESDRMSMQEVGKSGEGRPMFLITITAPANFAKLDRYKEISRRLAQVEGLTDDQARALAAEGKAVVWIDGGLHATEVLGPTQLIETIYQQVSRTDPETMRFLNDIIQLSMLVNPDGMELVSNWYMREPEPTKRSTSGIPVLYQKYAGHDNNRDFYMSALAEAQVINKVMYQDWFPQVVYNHHQTGPEGTVMFAPPFRDPFNFNLHPLLMMQIDQVGSAMHARFALEDKPGVTMRSGMSYSTWWNGGLRTTPYYHNMVGLLTETIGNPTPIEIPFIPGKHIPKGDYPHPIAPQKWHFRQSVDYSITANRAVLDISSRMKDTFLYNIYKMGKDAIAEGNRDSWTASPRRIAAVQQLAAADKVQPGRGGSLPVKYFDALRNPQNRDPRGYILSADQPDFLTAIKFANTLIRNGVTIHRATSQFSVGGKSYPAGSLIVKSAQPFRPHVLDMFEPQDHPDDFAYPGAPPTPPYDVAGYTLAYQMGVKFDRILEGFDGPFQKVSGEIKPDAGRITQVTGNAAGYLLSHSSNDSFVAVNRMLSTSEDVYWTKKQITANGKTYPEGTIFIPAKASTLPKLQKLAQDVGLNFDAVTARPSTEALMLRPLRIGVWDRYGGSMPVGWSQLVLEKFEFPHTIVYPKTLDEGNLSSKFDVLIFLDGGIPEMDRPAGGNPFGGQPSAESVPAEYRDRLGEVSVARTVPVLKRFLEDGGTILAIGSSTSMAYHTGLPIVNALVETTPDGRTTPLPRTKFYVPGSVLQARVDTSNPLAYGMSPQVDLFFDESPSFRLQPDAISKGVRPVVWFDKPNPLRSGWAWGQKYLQDSVAVVDAQVGKGKLFLFGPEILFRSQPHGTFKFLFNGIYYGRSEEVNLSQP